ncbi:MAG TPA: hypothetical protein VHM88_26965 [Candidatus Acidoferrales bacterium]|nr:hypothetical protein [Candidatus Acidoferrales bacterium]
MGLLVLFVLTPWALRTQAFHETVGRIEGEDIAVKGAVEVEEGRSITLLASGSEVTVRSGQARLLLAEGGEIGIYSPAHLSLLKFGGAITLALDYGRIHARLDQGTPLTVYTPLVVATPISIGEKLHDVTVNLEATGAMCMLAERGALRVVQQLTGQSILVPQGGEVAFTGGALDNLGGTAGSYQCDLLSARASLPPWPKPPELSVPVLTNLGRHNPANTEEPNPPAIEEPIYNGMMPPLTFDAAGPAPPPSPSEVIPLAHEVRVRPVEVFTGRVEMRGATPFTPTRRPERHAGLVTLIGNFFRRMLWGRAPCFGVGCG